MLRLLPTLLVLLALPCFALAQVPPDSPEGDDDSAEADDSNTLALTPGTDEAGRPVAAGPERPLVVMHATARLISPKGTSELLPIVEGTQGFLGLLTLAPNVAVPTHRDPVEEFVVLSEGGGIQSIDAGSWAVTPQDAIWMGAGAQVTFVNGPEPTTVLQAFGAAGPADRYVGWSTGQTGGLTAAELRGSFETDAAPPRGTREAPAVAGPGTPVVRLEAHATWTGGGSTELLKLISGRDANLGTYRIRSGELFPLVPEGSQELLVRATGPATIELDGLERALEEGQQVGLYVAPGSRATIQTPSEVSVTVLRVGPDAASAWAPWTPAFAQFLDRQRERLLGRLNGLRTAELARQAETDSFLGTAPCPSGNPSPWPRDWEGGCTAKFETLGWAPDAPEAYCTYQVRLTRESGVMDFEVTATCDLDGDGRFSRYKATSTMPAHRVSAVDVR
jgi:hypothetical protein